MPELIGFIRSFSNTISLLSAVGIFYLIEKDINNWKYWAIVVIVGIIVVLPKI